MSNQENPKIIDLAKARNKIDIKKATEDFRCIYQNWSKEEDKKQLE